MIVRAFDRGNMQALKEGIAVCRVWLNETTDLTGAVKINTFSLLFNADPWKSSRKALQAFEDKYPTLKA